MSPAPPRRRARERRAASLLLSGCLSAAAAGADPAPPDPVPPPPVIDAPEVTITATRSEEEVLDVPGNVTVVDRAAIERSGARSVPDLLRREAGLYVTNTTSNPLGYTVEARGFQSGGGNGCHTLVLMDGRRLNEPDTDCPDWSLVPIDMIERIEIVRGPVGAAYGDNSAGGVIQLITRHGRAEPGARAVAHATSGSFDTDAGNLWVEGAEGPLSATAFIDGGESNSYRDRADFDRQREELGLRFALAELGSLELQGSYATVHRKVPGDLTHPEWDDDARQAEPGSGDNFDDERERTLQARLVLEPLEGLRLEVAPYVRRTSQDTGQDDPAFEFTSDVDIDEHGVASQLEWRGELLGRSLRLLGGVDAGQEDADRSSLFDDGVFPFPTKNSSRRKTVGVFAHQELELVEGLSLSSGVRRDRADTEGEDELAGCAPGGFVPKQDRCPDERQVVWSPNAALTWRVAEPVSAYASYARGFRYPNLDEAFGFFGFAPRLEPEKSETWETGVKVRRQGLAVNLAVYQMHVSNEIFFDPTALNPITTFPGVNVNVDRVRHFGVELQTSWQWLDWLELYGSYTYEDTEIEQHRASPGLEGESLPITPKNRGDAGVRLTLPWGFEVDVNGYWVGPRSLANDVQNDDDELPSFASYDARIGWARDLTENLRLAIDVNGYNLTNRHYAEWGGISLFDPTDIGYFPAPRRSYAVGVRIEARR